MTSTWCGSAALTGVQARLQVDGAEAILQGNIDAEFHSIFIAGTGTGLGPIDDLAGLSGLAGRRFTFGSETSTSGRLMPQYLLDQAGGDTETDFAGLRLPLADPARRGRFGEDCLDRVRAAFLDLDPGDPTEAEILELFGAEEFIETGNGNCGEIEKVARDLGLAVG